MAKRIIKAILKYPLTLMNHIVLWSYYRWSSRRVIVKENMFQINSCKVLVLAPHVDDETIGLGGTLIKHAEKGSSIHCVYITDGSGSNTELPKEQIIRARKEEAKRIQDQIGIKEIYFMEEPDGSIQPSEELQRRLYDILDMVNPEIIYAPFLIDAHSDHVETTRNFISVLNKWNPNFSNLYMYEINCPIIPRLINEVSILDEEQLQQKIKLMEEFKTQESMAFDGFILLNRMKGQLVKDNSAAEIFIKANLQQIQEADKILIKEGFSYKQFRQLSNRYNLLLGFLQGYYKKLNYSKKLENVIK
ncbi:PIG-L deacetylase family protein [Alkaliphilus peptidifermentans]|uniref:N-acetylglucosaminyl deacetylase, LmbE family n=1 Tax=Alkaliphilus peptidifermentans DSM 18978 TaxID=1120976 RepID=A0A1G5GC11_9FIRM|nr:PIG-L family deacetylase [Alkaliphilus peptidifermentans]SCY49072.1 N-acetylglucosaminyl deacetylase, LmbE family [Alkaliphilus peptidifermentans DSM 18978]